MHVIIDGYNLLFSSFKSDSGVQKASSGFQKKGSLLEQSRNKLINLIKLFYQSHNDRVTIIFDGATDRIEYTNELAAVNNDYLTVLFSNKNISADDLIIKTAIDSVSKSEVLVVTSDNGIRHRLKPEGAKLLSSLDFMSMLIAPSLKNKQRSNESPVKDKKKLYGISPEEAEQWMTLFGFDSEDFSGIEN